jgi:hypothetical protein
MNAITQPTQTQPNENHAATLNETLRESALLASIRVSLWSGETSDPGIIEDARVKAEAIGNVGRAIKNLLAGADADLKAVKAAYAAMRAKHFALTLPFTSDQQAERSRGPRLLPTLLFQRYLAEMSAAKRIADAALDAFLDGYPDAVDKARANLGALAKDDYPTVAQLRARFRAEFTFEPIPASAIYRNIPESILTKLAASLQRKQAIAMEGALDAAFAAVRKAVSALHERLADPEGDFRVGTLDNVRDLAPLLPAWNVLGDERMAEIAGMVARLEPMLHAPTLRQNAAARHEAADAAHEIIVQLDEWKVG